MKVTIISASTDPTNGWGNITCELCSRLSQKVTLELYAPKDSKTSGDFGYEIKAILPGHMLSARSPAFLKMLMSALQIKGNTDIIHSLFAFPYAIPAAISAKLHRKPLIIGAQGTYGVKPLRQQPDHFLLEWAYRNANLVHCASKYTESRIRNATNIEHTCVIPNGVNYERFARAIDISQLREEFKPGKIILSVGALKPRKGYDVMLKAFRIVKEEIKDAKYLIVGEGSWQQEMSKLARQLKIEKDVYFLGEKTGDELVRYYHLCDVYAHTPVNIDDEFEGFGIVYLEAGACGKPVVASNSGGVPDAVLDGVTGLVVPESDVESTARALKRVLTDEKLAERLGANGRKRAEELSWSNIAQRFIEIYEGVLNGAKS